MCIYIYIHTYIYKASQLFLPILKKTCLNILFMRKWASLVAPLVKDPPVIQETWV